jgi:endonuclease IV
MQRSKGNFNNDLNPKKKHIEHFIQQMELAKKFGVAFVNSHSGYDGWSHKEK